MYFNWRFITLISTVLLFLSCNEAIMMTKPIAEYQPKNEEECKASENHTWYKNKSTSLFECLHTSDLVALMQLISAMELTIEPLDLGHQNWDNTRLTNIQFDQGAFAPADTIPSELGNFTHLIQLSLGNMYLTGKIPSTIGNLSSLEILELSIKCLENIIKLSKIGNPNSITDVGVALYLLYAAAKGASMNVIINANDLQENKKNKFIDQIEYYNKQADDLFNKINIIIDSHLK